MRGANVGRSEHAPRSIIPDRGQVTEDAIKSAKSEGWRVFHEHETGQNFANDAGELSPQSRSFAVDALTGPGNTDILAGKAARNAVNNSAPSSAVKTSHVGPNREGFKRSVVLSRDKHGLRVGVTLDGADGAPPGELVGEYAAASARE